MITDTFGELPNGGMLLIGIAGPARSGKDTAATGIIKQLGASWSRASFADPMKLMLNTIGVDTSDEAKDLPSNQFGVSTRRMLQTLGTEWGRDLIGEDFWVDVFRRMNAGRRIVVPDVRFENEAQLVRDHGALIHIMGRGGIAGDHVSESPLGIKAGDYVIQNDQSETVFLERVMHCLTDALK